MVDNGDEYTEGYMEPVDILTFIIYDVLESPIYHAIPDKIFSWNTMSIDPLLIFTLISKTTSASPRKE